MDEESTPKFGRKESPGSVKRGGWDSVEDGF